MALPTRTPTRRSRSDCPTAVTAADLAVGEPMPHALISFPYLSAWPLDKVAVGTNFWLLQVTSSASVDEFRRRRRSNGMTKGVVPWICTA
jgi:predicted RNA polymerase sigma factor